MMRKKIVSFISVAVAVMFIALSAVIPAAAADVSVTLSFSGSSVTVGNQVKLTVKYTGAKKIGSYNFVVNYDNQYLEYVSGADAGGSGTLSFVNVIDNGSTTLTKTVTFKALKVGTANVSVETNQMVDYDEMQNLSVPDKATKTVTIAAKPTASTDATLKSLSISPSSLTPSFSKSVTEYSATVEYAVTKLIVSAKPNDSKAAVSVSGADALKVGENTVSVTVTAESGAKKTYKITVTRKKSELADVKATVDGEEYTFAYDTEIIQPPAGYSAMPGKYGDRDVVLFSSENGLTLAALVDSDAETEWFIYDQTAGSFKKYIELKSAGEAYVPVDFPETGEPSGRFDTTPATVEIGGVSVSALPAKSDSAREFYLIYAIVGKTGEKGYYVYDSREGTIQRLMPFEAAKPADAQVVDTPSDQPGNKAVGKRDLIYLAAAGLLIVAGVVLMIITVVRTPRPEDYYDEE